jgi:hypothetical protein
MTSEPVPGLSMRLASVSPATLANLFWQQRPVCQGFVVFNARPDYYGTALEPEELDH